MIDTRDKAATLWLASVAHYHRGELIVSTLGTEGGSAEVRVTEDGRIFSTEGGFEIASGNLNLGGSA